MRRQESVQDLEVLAQRAGRVDGAVEPREHSFLAPGQAQEVEVGELPAPCNQFHAAQRFMASQRVRPAAASPANSPQSIGTKSPLNEPTGFRMAVFIFNTGALEMPFGIAVPAPRTP